MAEVETMRLFGSMGKVPVPKVYFYDATKAIIENEYFFMEKINELSLYSWGVSCKTNIMYCHM